jgi:hypothetical protein
MTKVLLAAAIATLLAMSPAHAEDDSFKNSGDTVSSAYLAPAKSADVSVDIPTREVPVEAQKSKATPKDHAPAPFAWVAEKVLMTVANFASKPIAGDAYAIAR